MSLSKGNPDTTTAPLVTVLMAVWNGKPYVETAVESILDQSLRDFEFLIIDDGSTDGTGDLLTAFQENDARIRVFHQENQGQTAALNQGLAMARGDYVARMDADDISLPERIERQVAFMDGHPEIGVCGSWVRTLGKGAGEVWRYPTEDAVMRSRMLFECALAHPSVMIRRGVLDANGLRYDTQFRHAQDYDLWVRCARVTRLANIDRVLVEYRWHPQKMGETYRSGMMEEADRVRLSQIGLLGIKPTSEEMDLHRCLSLWKPRPERAFLRGTDAWLRKLRATNSVAKQYPEPYFSAALAERWFNVCRRAAGMGLWSWLRFWGSPLGRIARVGLTQHLRFAVACGRKPHE